MAEIRNVNGDNTYTIGRMLKMVDCINVVTITGDATFGSRAGNILSIDGGASNRNVTALAGGAGTDSAEQEGMWYFLKNSGTTNNLLVRSSAPSTLATLAPGEWCVIAYTGGAWIVFSGSAVLAIASTWSALQTFGAGAALKDSVSYFYDDGDATKKAAIQCSGITTGTTRTLTVPDASGTLALTTSNISGSAGSVASTGYFLSSQQTGTGSAQNIAHGLGVTPNLVFAIPDDIGGGGVFSASYGSHDSTNVVVTFSNGQKYRIVAFK